MWEIHICAPLVLLASDPYLKIAYFYMTKDFFPVAGKFKSLWRTRKQITTAWLYKAVRSFVNTDNIAVYRNSALPTNEIYENQFNN